MGCAPDGSIHTFTLARANKFERSEVMCVPNYNRRFEAFLPDSDNFLYRIYLN